MVLSGERSHIQVVGEEGGRERGGGEVAERWKVCISVTCMRSLFYLENQFETELEFWNTRTTVYHVHIVQLLF